MVSKINSQRYIQPFLGIVVIAAVVVSVVGIKIRSPNALFVEQWNFTSPLSTPRRAHCAVATERFVYVIGGVDANDQYIVHAEVARIENVGRLSKWQNTSSLKQPRFYLDCVAYNGFIYVLGGGTGVLGDQNSPTASVERAQILDDGTLSDWTQVNQMTTPRRGLKTRIIGNSLFALGGYYGEFLKTVESTLIGADGTLSPWQLNTHKFQIDRYIHSAANYQHHLYLLGGHVNRSDKMSYGDVERATLEGHGMLSQWRVEASRINTPRFIASAFVLNRKLYIAGGHSGGVRINSVESAPLYRDGYIGQFEYATPLNTARSAAAVATSGQFAYILGGIGNEGVLNSVEFAQQSPQGTLGSLRPSAKFDQVSIN